MTKAKTVNIFDPGSTKSLRDYLITELKQRFDIKCKEFVNRLAEAGFQIGQNTLSSVSAFYRGDARLEIKRAEGGAGMYKATLILGGKDAAFVEFGAGVTFGTRPGAFPPLPTGNAYGVGFGVGTFPGQKHAEDPEGWHYRDQYGTLQHTYGNRAYMPLYHSEVEMVNKVRQIAREVFSG